MTTDDDPSMPCCDYRDHGSGVCACDQHERSTLHPYGHEGNSGDPPLTDNMGPRPV